ncbi:hypothetical protein [Haloarcula sediminis]|uniref:hypothetical protein n=1 Tax=Haloarcula sediminis TaxID=3111777 RepID=UPI002D7957B5|nr:hypothetical protein [Haloarcula sp. CK38]
MDETTMRALKLVALVGVAGVFLAVGLWVYLGPGLILGLAGPMFGLVLLLYVTNDLYATFIG